MRHLFPSVILVFGLLIGMSTHLRAQSFKQQVRKHRKVYKQQFLKEAHSPLNKKDLRALRFFPPDEAYQVKGEFTRTPDARPFKMATYSGITRDYVQYGVFKFSLRDTSYTLSIYRSLRLAQLPQYKDYLFLPFKDLTNGESTYGGGRYMDLRMGEVQEGPITIDFNRAYNPYCAYSAGYSCPIPPRENHLATPIKAGEQTYAGEYKDK